MKRHIFVLGLVGTVALAGCAQHRYLIELTNGDRLVSYSKPKRRGDTYYFNDEGRIEHALPRKRVAKITSGSVDEEPAAPPAVPFKPKPRHRHWYFFWLR